MQQAYVYLYFNQDSLFKPYITVPKQDKKNLQQWGFIEIWQLKHITKFTRIFSTLCQKLNQKKQWRNLSSPSTAQTHVKTTMHVVALGMEFMCSIRTYIISIIIISSSSNVAKRNLGKVTVNLEAMLVSSFPSYTRGGPMPLAAAPCDLCYLLAVLRKVLLQ